MQNFPYQSGYVGELTVYSDKIALALLNLAKQLNPRFSEPIRQDRIETLLSSPNFHQIICVEDKEGTPTIVGTANISVFNHSYNDNANVTDTPSLWLGSFVVDESVRRKGVAARVWKEILTFGASQGAQRLQFTSSPYRVAAHAFYNKMGARKIAPLLETEAPVPNHHRLIIERNFEFAIGVKGFVLSSVGDKPLLNDSTSQDKLTQLLPVPEDYDSDTTVLFSIDF